MPKRPAWERHRSSLAVQAGLVRAYSPLTAALLEAAVEWLDDPDGQGAALGDVAAVYEIGERLVELLDSAGAWGAGGIDIGWIDDLQPSLRLNACLHWYVLQGDPRVDELRPYYATVSEPHRKPTDDEFRIRLFAVAKALGPELFERARNWQVVTNETSRGICWLLPAVLLAAEAVHLVELSCSAGLNLYAEQRHYDLAWTKRKRLRVGRAADDQFLTVCEGAMPDLDGFSEAERRGPEVLSRVGGDAHPEELERPEFNSHLEACVWGDQRRRLDRLREGMAVHARALAERARGARDSLEPAQIRPLDLAANLVEFLRDAVPDHPVAPVIAYNSFATAYLSDVEERAVASNLREHAHRWALQHRLPWMWVRFEPARAGTTAPHPGWCTWQVELFSRGKHKSIDLGWAHPHLVRAEFGPGLIELRELRNRR
jgi:hypothetical protein